MCLGSQARAANKAAMENYNYQLKVRERNWMNTISQTNVERIQYAQTQDAAHVGLGNAYAEIQEKYKRKRKDSDLPFNQDRSNF